MNKQGEIKMKLLVCILAFITFNAHASVRVFKSDGVELGHFADVKCGYGTTCTQSSGKAYLDQRSQMESVVASSDYLDVDDCGKTFRQAAATSITMVLPEASTAIGCEYTFVSQYQGSFIVDPADATDSIVGVVNAAGDSVISTDMGNVFSVRAIGDDYWAVITNIGTWTDNN